MTETLTNQKSTNHKISNAFESLRTDSDSKKRHTQYIFMAQDGLVELHFVGKTGVLSGREDLDRHALALVDGFPHLAIPPLPYDLLQFDLPADRSLDL